ncbi:Calcium and integrin-binding protein 1, partial [Araneus ventricosus]
MVEAEFQANFEAQREELKKACEAANLQDSRRKPKTRVQFKKTRTKSQVLDTVFPMGQKQSILPEEKIREYEILTYLTEREIIKAYEKFCSMNPDVNPESLNPAISLERLDDLPELKVNPFKDRMIWVFTDPVSRCMTFEDYLDMMSVFSERAPLSLKAEYAFKIY